MYVMLSKVTNISAPQTILLGRNEKNVYKIFLQSKLNIETKKDKNNYKLMPLWTEMEFFMKYLQSKLKYTLRGLSSMFNLSTIQQVKGSSIYKNQ